MTPRAPKTIPGSIYRNGKRWWWHVKLPGEGRAEARPLKPKGERFATESRVVAETLARQLYAEASLRAVGERAGWPGTVGALCDLYEAHAANYYGERSLEPQRVKQSLKPLRELFAGKPAADLGPLDLKAAREKMIDAALTRVTINQRVGVIKRMFKWAVAEELLPPSVFHGLQALAGLRQGRTRAKEGRTVGPVDERWVRLSMKAMCPTLAAMVELQLLTGMRSEELCILRPVDLDASGRIWLYRPATHKTAHHGHERVVAIGPKAQKVLKPFLRRPVNSYCFSPAEAQHERFGGAQGYVGERYNSHTYRRAVSYAIERAQRDVDEDISDWTPHQLRHAAATAIRRELGLDAARAALGQKSLAIADTYAELDAGLAAEAARRLG